jgi:hypothetical protein
MPDNIENDLYMLFNFAFDGLDKQELKKPQDDSELDEINGYLLDDDEKAQVAIINTRSKLYPKALLYRKIVDGKAVLFAFWKRGTVCEAMVASLEGASVLNEFIWVQDASGKFKPTLKPKLDSGKSKERQAMMTRAAISTVLVESLNRQEYNDKFGGDIVKKLNKERNNMLHSLKERGLVPQDAVDPLTGRRHSVSASKSVEKTPESHDEFVAIQKDGKIIFTSQVVSGDDIQTQLAKALEREAMLADREEERANRRNNE